jgi:hypothetical protein
VRRFFQWCADSLELLKLSLRWQLGRRSWLVPALALVWPAYRALELMAGWRPRSFGPEDVQNGLIGVPLTVLAIGLGVRIVAGEIELRTLEVTYTVPGGARRVWVSKLCAAALPLLVAAALLGVITAVFFTPYSFGAFYGAVQGAIFFLALAMGFGALLRSELTAALVALLTLLLTGFVSGFGEVPRRWSPLFNPLAVESDAVVVVAWTIQNRIGVALAVLALVALASVRAERREQLLRI